MNNNANENQQPENEIKLIGTLSPIQNSKPRKFGRRQCYIRTRIDVNGELKKGDIISINNKAIQHIHDSHRLDPKRFPDLLYTPLEVIDVNGHIFDATLETAEQQGQVTIENCLFSAEQAKQLMQDFSLKNVTAEELSEHLNDSIIEFVRLREIHKSCALKLQEKRDLLTTLRKAGDNFFEKLLAFSALGADLHSEEFLSDNRYIDSEDELQDFLQYDDQNIFCEVERRIIFGDTSVTSASEEGFKKSFSAAKSSLIEAKKEGISINLEILNDELKSYDSRLFFCQVDQLLYILPKFLNHIDRSIGQLFYVPKGNTSQQECEQILQASRRIYKDYFCTSPQEAITVEQNVQHIDGGKDKHGDKDESKGQLSKFVYAVMGDVKSKTGIKIWKEDVLAENLCKTKNEEMNNYRFPSKPAKQRPKNK